MNNEMKAPLASIIYHGSVFKGHETHNDKAGQPLEYVATKENNGYAVWVVELAGFGGVSKPKFLHWFAERDNAIETSVSKVTAARAALKS